MLFEIHVFIFICVFPINTQNSRDRRPFARLSQGLVAGVKAFSDSGQVADAFLGLPYAAPPIKNLRFAPPQKHHGWNGTYIASEYGTPCPQLTNKLKFSANEEDCLFLNIWTPENAVRYGNYPVVIFFEGNDFATSNSFPISGQDLAVEGVVVVTVNYRLNVFGFLCLGTSEARGNFGLLDQYFALLWVRVNIKHFGGDSEKITLFGHSSGGASVTFHMVSPRTAGLFHRAIISTGSAISPWQKSNNPITASRQIIRILGCDTYTTSTLMCLRSKTVEHILRAFEEYTESPVWRDKFLPVIDTFLSENNQYLPNEPGQALKDGTYLQVPILTGVTKPISNPQYLQWIELASQGYMQLLHYAEKIKIPEIIKLYQFNEGSREQIFDLIKWRYISPSMGNVRLLYEQIKNLEFEAKIEAPHFLQLNYLVTSYVQPIYVYYIDDIGLTINDSDSTITSDLLLTFGPLLFKQVGYKHFNSNELYMSNYIKQLWKNFIIFGNPTPNNQAKIWRKYTSGDNYIQNLIIDSTISNDITMNRISRMSFWTQLLPKIEVSHGLVTNNIPKELQNSPDPASGFRHAMYTLVGLVIALLALLIICIILLKRRSKERERHLHMVY